MVTACVTCGALGFIYALVTCEKCQIYSQHRYCAKELSLTGNVVWFCEDCEPKCDEVVEIPSKKSERLEAIIYKAKTIPKETAEDDIPVTVSKSIQQRCDIPILLPDEQCKMVTISEPAQPAADIANHGNFCEKETDGPSENLANFDEKSSKQILKKDDHCDSVEKIEWSKKKISKIRCQDNVNDALGIHSHIPAQPLIDSIWRGKLDICNKTKIFKNFGVPKVIKAHVTNKACLMVYEEAKLLPSFLVMDLLPKSEMWPKSYEKSSPKNDNIGLYIFPENPLDEAYISLVNTMVCEDLGLRVMVENAELLVFTSSELSLRYWKFEGKQYLWGVFKRKVETTSAHKQPYPQTSNKKRLFSNDVKGSCDSKQKKLKENNTLKYESSAPLNSNVTGRQQAKIETVKKSDSLVSQRGGKKPLTCYGCHQLGHRKFECPNLHSNSNSNPNPNPKQNLNPNPNPKQTLNPNPNQNLNPTSNPNQNRNLNATPNPNPNRNPAPKPNPNENPKPTPNTIPNSNQNMNSTPVPNPDRSPNPTLNPNPNLNSNENINPTPNTNLNRNLNPTPNTNHNRNSNPTPNSYQFPNSIPKPYRRQTPYPCQTPIPYPNPNSNPYQNLNPNSYPYSNPYPTPNPNQNRSSIPYPNYPNRNPNPYGLQNQQQHRGGASIPFNACFNCGEPGHHKANCPYRKSAYRNPFRP